MPTQTITLGIILFLIGLLIGNIRKKTLTRTIEVYSGFKQINREVPYLIRWTIIKTKWFSIKIHKILLSDPEEPHDHPWNYLSIILWGGYWEYKPKSGYFPKELYPYGETRKWYRPGSFLFRKGNQLHKLGIPYGRSAISLVITTRRWRDWGFQTDSGWKQFEGESTSDYGKRLSNVPGATVSYKKDETREKITSFIRQRLDADNIREIRTREFK